MTKKITAAAAFCLLPIALPAQAQNVPTLPIVPKPIPAPELPRNLSPTPLVPKPDLTVPPGVLPSVPEPQPEVAFKVSRFVVEGGTVFDRAQIDEITAPYLNRRITFRDLQQIRSTITDLYVRQGFVTSGAFIPPQTLRNGVATIRIVEGKLERIDIRGSDRLANYIRARLAVAASPVVNRQKLLQELRLLQNDTLVKTISADLAVGSQVGLSTLSVRVTANPTTRVAVELNNRRSPTIGTFERRLEVSQANLLGLGDNLAIAYSNTNGSNGGSLNYTIPVSTNNATLSVAYSTQFDRIIEAPFNALDIRANSKVYELSYRQPIFRTATERTIQEFAVGVSVARLESETSILGIRQALTPGADAEGQTKISELRVFQEFLSSRDQQVLQVRSQFSVGVNALGSTRNPSPPDGQFFIWRGQAAYLQKLGPRPYLLTRAEIQLADRPLVPLEQFEPTVREYRQDATLGDNGIFGSIELHVPVITTPQSEFQLVPFVDAGHVWSHVAASATLASIGLGMQWTWGNLTARLDYGIPFTNRVQIGNTLQEVGLTGSIRYTASF